MGGCSATQCAFLHLHLLVHKQRVTFALTTFFLICDMSLISIQVHECLQPQHCANAISVQAITKTHNATHEREWSFPRQTNDIEVIWGKTNARLSRALSSPRLRSFQIVD